MTVITEDSYLFFHYSVPEGLAIAFNNEFMTREQYLEQDTGMVSLQYAMPKNKKENPFFFDVSNIGYSTGSLSFAWQPSLSN